MMKNNKFSKSSTALIALGLIFTVFYACRKNEVASVSSVNYYYTYFPLKTGSTYIYRVDSLTWDQFKFQYDTSVNYLKEVIDSPFIDLMGDPAFKVIRYWRHDTLSTTPWINQRVWTTKRTLKTAERWEENIRYIRLAFPVFANRSWNGNQLNHIDTFNQYNYHYVEIHKPFTMALTGINYDSTVLVNQINYYNALQGIVISERYAAKVGLIYKEMVDTESNGLNRVAGSYFYKQTLLNFSK